MRNPRRPLPSTLTPRIKTTLYKKLCGAASPRRAARVSLVAAILVAFAAMLYTSSSASAPGRVKKADGAQPPAAAKAQTAPAPLPEAPTRLKAAGVAPLTAMLWQVSFADAVSTYASGCGSAQSSFSLGDTVCAQVSGPVSASRVLRRVQLVNPAGLAIDSLDVTTNPQTVTFTLPSDTTTTFNDLINPGDSIAVDNRGTWRIVSTETSDGGIVASAAITVHGPTAAADLQISKTITGDDTLAVAGANIQSVIWVFNAGPDTALNVHFTDTTPSNTTFQSLTPTDGSASDFTCTTPAVNGVGTTTCTKSSMANGETAGFIITYKVSASIANGSELTSTSSITSDTAEAGSANNTSDSTTPASNPTTPTCSLTCPANVAATADTVENVDTDGDGVPDTPTSGTHVTLPDATASGSTCGTVTSSKPSGSFFPVGTTPVTYTASDGTTCNFLVTVTSSGSPVTISCPANVTVNADANCQATITLGTPTTTGDNVTVTSSRSDGKPLSAPFSSGVTNVTWTATNSSGTESCTQSVTVNDVTPPVINVPAQSASADANCQAAIPDLTNNPGITDNCACDSSDSAEECAGHPHVSVAQDPAPGTLVGLGPHTITLTANDGSSNNSGGGNTTVAQVTFTVNDTTPPAFTFVPPAVTANTGAGATSCDTVVDPGTATASDNCGTVNVTRSPSGNTFPVGTTTITWTATDGAGNTATATQTVTVTDNTSPTITAPPAVTANTGAGATTCDAVVSVGTATASDNCSGVTVSRSPAGNTFPVGNTTVTWTATDAAGNTATATQTVTVVDNTPPTISAPPAVTANTGAGASSCDAVVNVGTASASDNCGTVNVTRSPSGNTFPVGNTTVTWTATDSVGNTATATQTVTVVDNTPPVISCPVNITVFLPLHTTATSTTVSYPAASATDNCGGTTIAYSKASGSVFNVGTTPVTATATDTHGNSASCTFNVTVLYDFTGFFSPVGNLPTVNSVNAGRAIPVKFSLSGNKSLNIFAADSPSSAPYTCGNVSTVDVSQTVDATSNSINYDAGSDQYNYVWKTDSSWAGQCRTLTVTLNDGSTHTALFKFR